MEIRNDVTRKLDTIARATSGKKYRHYLVDCRYACAGSFIIRRDDKAVGIVSVTHDGKIVNCTISRDGTERIYPENVEYLLQKYNGSEIGEGK